LGGEHGSGTGHLLQQYFGADARTIGVSMQLGSTEAVKHAVQAGLGISLVMAAAVTHEVRNGQLHAIPIEGEPMQKTLYVIRRDGCGQKDGPAAQFVDFLLKSP
jgi:DNA-binding transcriptional LysR family regulator